jgi:hypothetical protein
MDDVKRVAAFKHKAIHQLVVGEHRDNDEFLDSIDANRTWGGGFRCAI